MNEEEREEKKILNGKSVLQRHLKEARNSRKQAWNDGMEANQTERNKIKCKNYVAIYVITTHMVRISNP